MTDVLLLHNERAGDGGHARDDLIGLLRRAGFRAIDHELHAALRTPGVLERGEFVVVAGGDGSIRKVATALLGRDRALAPLPTGTANNIARSLGLRGTVEEIVAGWRRPRRERFDVGLATGPWGTRPVFEGVGVGLVSRGISLIERLDEASGHEFKTREDRLHRDLCVFAALAHEVAPLRIELAADDATETEEFLLLEILNIPRAGPGLVLAPAADPSDGWFDVVTVTAAERPALQEKLRESLAGSNQRTLPLRRARRLACAVPRGEIRLDDEIVSLEAPAEVVVEMRAGALQVVLPA